MAVRKLEMTFVCGLYCTSVGQCCSKGSGMRSSGISPRHRETGEHAQCSFTGTVYTVQDDEDPHRTSLQVRIGHTGLDSKCKFNLDLASGFGKRRAGL